MSPKKKVREKGKKLKTTQSLIHRKTKLNKIKSNPFDIIEKTKKNQVIFIVILKKIEKKKKKDWKKKENWMKKKNYKDKKNKHKKKNWTNLEKKKNKY